MEQVRRMVASGQLEPGTELPSVREVAAEYTVNPTTISKAYSLLESEGLVERNRGKPMTVAAVHRGTGSLEKRLKQIQPQVETLVLAARQLELGSRELCDFITRKMGDES
jgi:GntR family transcriptional regulator